MKKLIFISVIICVILSGTQYIQAQDNLIDTTKVNTEYIGIMEDWNAFSGIKQDIHFISFY